MPLRLRSGEDVLSFLGTVTTFGTAVDLTAAELSIEAFLPAGRPPPRCAGQADRGTGLVSHTLFAGGVVGVGPAGAG